MNNLCVSLLLCTAAALAGCSSNNDLQPVNNTQQAPLIGQGAQLSDQGLPQDTPKPEPDYIEQVLSEQSDTDAYEGFYAINLSQAYGASGCDLTMPQLDISMGIVVDWPLCKLFYRQMQSDTVTGYFELSFALDDSNVILIPNEFILPDSGSIEDHVIGVLLKEQSPENTDNLCLRGDIYALGRIVNNFAFHPHQYCQ